MSDEVNIKNANQIRNQEKNITIYILTKELTDVQYVGRTKNPERREQQHKNDSARKILKFQTIPGKYTSSAARGIEQILIMGFDTLKRRFPMYNQINGINFANPNLEFYASVGQKELEESGTSVGN